MTKNVVTIEPMKQDLGQHIAKITGGMSLRKISEEIGAQRSTFVAQMAKHEETGKGVPVEIVMAICRRFNAPFIPAFVAAGYMTSKEAERIITGVDKSLSEISDEELGEEVMRRLKSGKAGRSLTEPLDEKATVVQLHPDLLGGGAQDEHLSSDEKMVARKNDSPKLGDEPDR